VQARASTDIQPVIEVLAHRLARRDDVASKIPLRGHVVEVRLSGPQPAMNEFADVPALPGFGVATDLDSDKPSAGSTTNNLANFVGHVPF
jgi:hypothetical protein